MHKENEESNETIVQSETLIKPTFFPNFPYFSPKTLEGSIEKNCGV